MHSSQKSIQNCNEWHGMNWVLLKRWSVVLKTCYVMTLNDWRYRIKIKICQICRLRVDSKYYSFGEGVTLLWK